MRYRPEIDGLRAVAVLPVLFFHAGFDYFSGGYIGVDIFFVISGYLITSLILAEQTDGRFTFLGFYERRARRILPALFTVALVCIPFAWAWMQPRQLEDFAQSLMAVALFGSNFLFWKEEGYFEAQAELKPLLHTWSLGVEEQFYILFPLLILLLWPYGRRRLTIFLGVTALASLGLAEWMAEHAPSANFYLLPSRAWELFAGALCAFYLAKREGRAAHNGLSLAGLALIVTGFFVIDSETPFPSLFALPPVVGTALIILFGGPTTLAGRLLALRPLVFVGLISYSLYLWHQPLFAFARIRSLEDPPPLLYGLLIAVAVGLALLTWQLVEKPFRNRKAISRKQIFAVSGAGMVLLIGLGAAGDIVKGFPGRSLDTGESLAALETRLAPNNGLSSACDRSFSLRPECQTSDAPEIAVWGDSYAMHLVDGLLAADPEARLIQITKSVCGPFAGLAPIIPPRYPESWAQGCLDFNDAALDWIIQSGSVKYVVLSSPFTQYLTDRARFLTAEGEVLHTGDAAQNRKIAADHLKKTLLRLTANGIRPVIISPPPQSGEEIGQCLAKSSLFGFDATACDFDYGAYAEKHATLIEFLETLAAEFDVIWLKDYICEGPTCRAAVGETFLYRDTGHLSHEGSRLVGREMDFIRRISE